MRQAAGCVTRAGDAVANAHDRSLGGDCRSLTNALVTAQTVAWDDEQEPRSPFGRVVARCLVSFEVVAQARAIGFALSTHDNEVRLFGPESTVGTRLIGRAQRTMAIQFRGVEPNRHRSGLGTDSAARTGADRYQRLITASARATTSFRCESRPGSSPTSASARALAGPCKHGSRRVPEFRAKQDSAGAGADARRRTNAGPHCAAGSG
jgi:hypothetical protein